MIPCPSNFEWYGMCKYIMLCIEPKDSFTREYRDLHVGTSANDWLQVCEMVMQ